MSTWFSQSLPEPPDLIRGEKKFKAGHGGTCTNPSTWKEGAADICELETSLRYMASSTPAGATARPSLKKKKVQPHICANGNPGTSSIIPKAGRFLQSPSGELYPGAF